MFLMNLNKIDFELGHYCSRCGAWDENKIRHTKFVCKDCIADFEHESERHEREQKKAKHRASEEKLYFIWVLLILVQ